MDNRIITTDVMEEDFSLEGNLRPQTLDEYIGQEKTKNTLKVYIEAAKQRHDSLDHVLFYGPPGLGKTTLSGIIANEMGVHMKVTSGPAIEKPGEMAAILNNLQEGDILFVDEIHRFNKAQQDAFLPFVEKGSIILIGATTENPSFEVNSALLSRCKVFVLKGLEPKDLMKLLDHALTSPSGFGGQHIMIQKHQKEAICAFANGDARTALNTLEMAVLNGEMSAKGIRITDECLEQCISRKSLLYDKTGEEHYNLISALHKSMRNSDPDAAIYWMCRMLEGGENPLYIARRLIRFASEDIGMADSGALQIAVAAYQACHFLGMPECDVHLAHAVTYLAMAPKSNALYRACESCRRDVREQPAEPVPLVLRNAPTGLMRELNYGKGYEYAHNTEEKLTRMRCMPDSLKDRIYYAPTDEGAEHQVKERLQKIKEWKRGKMDVEQKATEKTGQRSSEKELVEAHRH